MILFPPFCSPSPIFWREGSETGKATQTASPIEIAPYCFSIGAAREEKKRWKLSDLIVTGTCFPVTTPHLLQLFPSIALLRHSKSDSKISSLSPSIASEVVLFLYLQFRGLIWLCFFNFHRSVLCATTSNARSCLGFG